MVAHNNDPVIPLIEALYALDEPWRSRFLKLAANLFTGWCWNGREPQREELTA